MFRGACACSKKMQQTKIWKIYWYPPHIDRGLICYVTKWNPPLKKKRVVTGKMPLLKCNLSVSENNGIPKSSHFNRVFHYKPSILGYPYFWKHPNAICWHQSPLPTAMHLKECCGLGKGNESLRSKLEGSFARKDGFSLGFLEKIGVSKN